MARVLIVISFFFLGNFIIAQSDDTLFEKRISAFSWMPDGNAIILNVLKVDKSENTRPIPKKFKFSIASNAVEFLPIDGGGLVVSPDGKSVAYIKQVHGKDQIYLYDFSKKEDKPIVIDTFKKYAVSWSTDGKNLVYNIQIGKGAKAKVEICIYNIKRNKVKQITKNSAFKCYTPNWNAKNNKILYNLEKGDKRDQIYLTDEDGSFHTNLTNDTTTHNYSPYWLDNKTIMFIQSPDNVMTMKIDGAQKQRIEGISTTLFRYNKSANSVIYLSAEGNLMIFDLKAKTKKVLIEQNKLDAIFEESYFVN